MVFGKNGMIDPTRSNDYLGIEGYQALAKVLSEMTPEQVINVKSKARFARSRRRRIPCGREVGRRAQGAHGDPKYVIANGVRRPRRLHGQKFDGRQSPQHH